MFEVFRKKNAPILGKQMLVDLFFSKREHQWIVENKYIKANFEEFFDYIPQSLMDTMVRKYDVTFATIDGKYSCAVSSANVILVFPELYDLLASTALSNYKAILAHELGHIIHNHGQRQLSILDAQVEADDLAIRLGFCQDLENFLLDQPESIEKRIRLSYLTSKYYNNNM